MANPAPSLSFERPVLLASCLPASQPGMVRYRLTNGAAGTAPIAETHELLQLRRDIERAQRELASLIERATELAMELS